MILGTGLLANAFAPVFADDEQILIFASGVSNSSELNPEAFARERVALQSALTAKHQLVYFSSCAVANAHQPPTPYFQHKLEMEQLVLSRGGIVFRLPQVVGRSRNPNTLTNFLFDRINQQLSFELWVAAERNLIDVDDVVAIATHMIRRNLLHVGQPESIAAKQSVTMLRIVRTFEEVLGKKADFQAIEQALPFPIQSALCQRVAAELGIEFDDGYLSRLLRKYYAT